MCREQQLRAAGTCQWCYVTNPVALCLPAPVHPAMRFTLHCTPHSNTLLSPVPTARLLPGAAPAAPPAHSRRTGAAASGQWAAATALPLAAGGAGLELHVGRQRVGVRVVHARLPCGWVQPIQLPPAEPRQHVAAASKGLRRLPCTATGQASSGPAALTIQLVMVHVRRAVEPAGGHLWEQVTAAVRWLTSTAAAAAATPSLAASSPRRRPVLTVGPWRRPRLLHGAGRLLQGRSAGAGGPRRAAAVAAPASCTGCWQTCCLAAASGSAAAACTRWWVSIGGAGCSAARCLPDLWQRCTWVCTDAIGGAVLDNTH